MTIKIIMVVLALLAFSALAIFWLGSHVPVHHRAITETSIRQTPEEIYSVISDVEHASSWRPDVIRTELIAPASDGTARITEHSARGSMTYRIEVAERPSRFVTRIDGDTLPFGGTWTITITRQDAGSTVRIVEDGDVRPIFFRFVSRYVLGYYGTMQTYLTALSLKFGETASIRVIAS